MSDLLAQAILIGLASWRVTALLSYERGPLGVFLWFRKFLSIHHNDQDEPVAWPNNIVTEALSCPWCLGLWAAAAMYGIWQLEPVVVMVIAASTVLVAVEKWNHA